MLGTDKTIGGYKGRETRPGSSVDRELFIDDLLYVFWGKEGQAVLLL